MTISAILKGRKDDKDRLTVTIRITNGDDRKFKATKIKVRPDQFHEGKIINHPQATHLNRTIEKLKEEMMRKHNVMPDDEPDNDFYKYAHQCFRKWSIKKKKGDSTINQYKSKVSILQEWFPGLQLDDINKEWCERLHFRLLKEGLLGNTIWNYFKTVSVIINQAIDDHLLIRNEVKHYKDKPTYKDPKKIYLTPKQIHDLERYAEVATPERRHCALWFLIGCYTGLRHSDMVTFDKNKNIIGDRLVKSLVKTKNTISLPVQGKIRELFESVEWKPLRIKNQPFNRMMKRIAEDCGIEQNITCHTSRHSAGMMLAEAGVSIEITAAILGHKDTKHTKVYYHLTNKRVDNEIGKILG